MSRFTISISLCSHNWQLQTTMLHKKGNAVAFISILACRENRIMEADQKLTKNDTLLHHCFA